MRWLSILHARVFVGSIALSVMVSEISNKRIYVNKNLGSNLEVLLTQIHEN